jgi:hypothetical protein
MTEDEFQHFCEKYNLIRSNMTHEDVTHCKEMTLEEAEETMAMASEKLFNISSYYRSQGLFDVYYMEYMHSSATFFRLSNNILRFTRLERKCEKAFRKNPFVWFSSNWREIRTRCRVRKAQLSYATKLVTKEMEFYKRQTNKLQSSLLEMGAKLSKRQNND